MRPLLNDKSDMGKIKVELVNDLSGYQLIFPLPLHVIGTFFLRVNEGRLWNTL